MVVKMDDGSGNGIRPRRLLLLHATRTRCLDRWRQALCNAGFYRRRFVRQKNLTCCPPEAVTTPFTLDRASIDSCSRPRLRAPPFWFDVGRLFFPQPTEGPVTPSIPGLRRRSFDIFNLLHPGEARRVLVRATAAARRSRPRRAASTRIVFARKIGARVPARKSESRENAGAGAFAETHCLLFGCSNIAPARASPPRPSLQRAGLSPGAARHSPVKARP